ncbi:molecular chaperone DnaJ, partial [Pseudomonas syringae pv. pisi]
MERKILNVQILPGLKSGDKCIIQGMADEGKNMIPGDVIIHLQEVPHPSLVRRNNDLYL